MAMASALNETGHKDESVSSNPAAVLGGDTPFFSCDSSAWGAETFLAFTKEVLLPIAAPLPLPGRYCRSRKARSFGVEQENQGTTHLHFSPSTQFLDCSLLPARNLWGQWREFFPSGH